MKLSLVICTRDRASHLEVALKSILRLYKHAPWELVIIDNGSKDSTQSVIEHFRAQFTEKLLTYYEPIAGLGNARNRGWTIASGDIIVFTDDDCYPAEDFLVTVTQCFKEDDRLGFLGGRILLYDETDCRITIQERKIRQEIIPGDFIPTGLIQGANFACRRSALQSVRGFDWRFGVGSLFACEEIDIIARMSARGWYGAFDPRPIVYHHHGRKTAMDVERLMNVYDRGRGAYYAKCLMNPVLRATYFKKWCRFIRYQPLPQTYRELIAGGEFFLRAALQRSHSPVNIERLL